jgi:hypothetical protein
MSDYKSQLDKANARLDSLYRIHRDLDEQIKKEFDNFSKDSIIKGLKRKKLGIKQQITDLESILEIVK